MDPFKECDRLIKIHNGKLVRSGKNNVFKFPNGFMLIAARTPSDHRAGLNQLKRLQRGLGVARPAPAEPPKEAVLDKTEARCASCRRLNKFPHDVEDLWVCRLCGELNMEGEENAN